ncbi:hypothetical protein FOXB_17608 [Fusarium oxysporum f. sp. conglutinans Fo5176]|uniref:Uncharacterized protein n=1 Tax=Fusarium oxysporum (strain Fo5176) TaxID=660025 RepID=F9GG24_FUSOF|nr:hypothetical protein FOXB_17608 [Fusarium oxysporum f. sp. conglutinans Fo5176]
MSNVQKGTGL